MTERPDIPDLNVDFSKSSELKRPLLHHLLTINDSKRDGQKAGQSRGDGVSPIMLSDDDLEMLAAAGDLSAQEALRRQHDDDDV